MKRKTKQILYSVVGVASASLVVAACYASFRPQPVLPLDVYLVKFDENNPNKAVADANKVKNTYIDKMIKQTNHVLDWYEDYYQKTYGEKFPGLTFDFINLNSAPTDGDRNYFTLLDRSLKAIDKRLGFNTIPRTPAAVQQGHYQKNIDMLSFYWNPDFNDITTWLAYMFTDDFVVPNQWPALYEKLKNPVEPWETSLKNELVSKGYYYSSTEVLNSILDPSSSPTGKAIAHSLSAFYTELTNIIGVWISSGTNSNITLKKSAPIVSDSTSDSIKPPYDSSNYDKVTMSGEGVELVKWLSSQIINIPFVENGPDSSTPFLIRNGYFNPTNPNTDTNFRDWYFNSSVTPSSTGKFRWWTKPSPFEVNKTPYNPAFSHSPSSQFFGSTYGSLTSWTTTYNFDRLRDPGEPVKADETYLVSVGTTQSVEELERSGYNSANNTMSFNIRPIPWINYQGQQLKDDQNRPAFLSPADFMASLIAFVRSIQIKINTNAYFLDIIGIDVEATIKDPANKERNLSKTDNKPFIFHFKKKPDIPINLVLDVFQKQYFCAIPAFKQSVKNITDYDTFRQKVGSTELLYKNDKDGNKIPIMNKFIPSEQAFNFSPNIDFNQFYGSGNPTLDDSLWQDYASVGPYYVSYVDKQKIIYKLNTSFFDCFTEETKIPGKDGKPPMYQSFKLSQEIEPTPENHNKDVNVIKRIGEISLKYAGSYSESLTYEQFKANELDLSEVSSARLLEAEKSYPKDFRSQWVEKLNKCNLITYNLNVFLKNDEDVILDTNEQPIVNKNGHVESLAYSIDKYGNYVFPEGRQPKIKSKIDHAYYDLIVRDFYTPLEAYNGDDPSIPDDEKIYAASATIRETINNAINWVSLKSVVYPGITKAVQYSFLPYGVYDLYTGDPNDIRKFWWYASYKPYMTNEELLQFNKLTYEKRKCGIIIWTYDELLNNIIKGEEQ